MPQPRGLARAQQQTLYRRICPFRRGTPNGAGISAHLPIQTSGLALLSARYETDGFRFIASIPRMRISSNGSFFTGLGGSPLFVAPGIAPSKRIREGWGDVTVGSAYLLPGGEGRGFDIEVSANVKIPTASKASQLSTGRVDYSGGAELSKSISRFTPAVNITYRVFGDTRDFHFRNGFDVTAGSTYAITPRALLLLNYEYARSSSVYIKDSHELVAGASFPVASDRLRLTSYISKGLSQGASSVSGGAALAFRF